MRIFSVIHFLDFFGSDESRALEMGSVVVVVPEEHFHAAGKMFGGLLKYFPAQHVWVVITNTQIQNPALLQSQ